MWFIGIDLGATFLKGAWMNPEKDTLEFIHRESFPAFQEGLPEGHCEVSADEISIAVSKLLKNLLLAASDRKCEGLFVCGQMHGFVLVRADGGSVGPFVSWQDSRSLAEATPGQSYFNEARQRLGPVLMAELGNEFRPGLPVSTLFAIAKNKQLPKGLVPMALADFIVAKLTGGGPMTDATNAAAHGLMNVAKGAWHYDALTALGLEFLRLPEIVETGAKVGTCHFEGQQFPVFAAVGDQQAALLGAELLEGELSLNIATGSQVSSLSRDASPCRCQLRPYFDGLYLRTMTHLPAGRALNRLVSLCGELAVAQGTPIEDPWKVVMALAEVTNPGRLRANLAFFPSGVGDEGSFTCITENELTVGHLFRAAFVSMALNYENAAGRVSPKGWSKVVFSGGLVQKSKLLQREILMRLGESHRFASHQEDTLAGLLLLSRRNL